jgi:hypothetical protein
MAFSHCSLGNGTTKFWLESNRGAQDIIAGAIGLCATLPGWGYTNGLDSIQASQPYSNLNRAANGGSEP